MKVKDVMTTNPVCCSADTSLIDVARLMIGYDCGELPVIENNDGKKLLGVITDRDIVCRSIGQGINPMGMTAGDCMSAPALSIENEASFDDCLQLMQNNQIRRVPVTDGGEKVCGIVSLADITKYSTAHSAGEVLREVSIESGSASGILQERV